MGINAFQVQGKTVALSVTATAHAAVQVPNAGAGSYQYVVTNLGPNECYLTSAMPDLSNGTALGVAPTPTLAAVIPADGTPANGFPILAGTSQTITTAPNAFFSAICAAAKTATLLITPGDGV